jgi:phosphoserine phosphatase
LTTKIILTRHGHVEGIEPRRFRGRQNIPLSKLGRAQAAATAQRISALWRPRMVYTSPMGRCVETSAAIAEACGAATTVLETLNDLDYGAWQWKSHKEIGAAFPEMYQRWHEIPQMFRFPRGESLQDLVARTADALRYVLQKHGEQTVVLVGHDSVNRALLIQVLDQPLSAYWKINFDPCGISVINFAEARSSVQRINEVSHLENITVAPAS